MSSRRQILTFDLLFQFLALSTSIISISYHFGNFGLMILLLLSFWQFLISPIIFGWTKFATRFILVRKIPSCLNFIFIFYFFFSLLINPFAFYGISQNWFGWYFLIYTLGYFLVTLADFFGK